MTLTATGAGVRETLPVLTGGQDTAFHLRAGAGGTEPGPGVRDGARGLETLRFSFPEPHRAAGSRPQRAGLQLICLLRG